MTQSGRVGVFSAAALLLVAGMAAAGSKSVSVELREEISFNGTTLKAGKYKVSWTGDSELQVKVTSEGKVVAESRGRLEERKVRAEADAVVSRQDASGALVLSEIRLGGKKSVLVFPAS